MENTQNFYSPPKYTPGEISQSAFHKEMLHIAFSHRKSIVARHWRSRRLNKFHLIKFLFFIRQPYFYSRLSNYIRYKREAFKKARVSYLPPSVQIESSTGCALHCPGCLIGTTNETGHPDKIHYASIGLLKKEVDLIYKKSFQLFFHMHAEPLLNENFFPACAYANSKGLWTGIHTNLVTHIKDLPQKLIDCKLKNLVVSIDGATEETYQKYRKGGDLQYVLSVMKDIDTRKKKCGTSFPFITAKFLVFEHNWHEIKQFRKLALEHGANEVVYVTGYANGTYLTGKPCTEYEYNLDELQWEPFHLPRSCPFLWTDLRIDIDGGLFGCGNGHRQEHKFFSYQHDHDATPMQQQFNAEKFIALRNYFLGENIKGPLPEPCRDCTIVHRYGHFTVGKD